MEPRDIRRWRRHWEKATRAADRLSRWRVALFLGGSFLTLLLLGLGLRSAAEVSALGFTAAFVGVALAHHRLAEKQHEASLRLRLAESARAKAALDWEKIDELPGLPAGRKFPKYFWDLDLVRGRSLLRLVQATASSGGWRRLLDYFDGNSLSLAEIRRRQKRVEDLFRLRVLRRRFLGVAQGFSKQIDTESLLTLVGASLHTARAPIFFLWILAAQGGAVLLFAASALKGLPPWFLLLGAAAALLYRYGGKEIQILSAYGDALVVEASLSRLLQLVAPLKRLRRAAGADLAEVLGVFEGDRDPRRELKRLERVTGFLGVRQNPLLHFGLNLVFPWDFFWTLRLERIRREIAVALPQWLEALSEIEALASLAEWHATHPDYRVPALTEAYGLRAKGIGHPLIDPKRRVGNDLALGDDAKAVLLTGSNMSGKSTFLRSLGINLVLAKAGAAVAAESLETFPFRLFTSLRVEDSLEDNLSSFYAEVKELKTVLDEAKRGSLYLIDEIFRGTNNRERLIGSRAYLKALARTDAMGLVTTHDLELTQLPAELPALKNGHFKEDIEGGKMTFSYRLSEGPCPTTNALQVMALAGLPTEDSKSEL
jgi:hypothetical protein